MRDTQAAFLATPASARDADALAARIRALRKSLDMTQAAFAEEMDVTQPTVHRWENAIDAPDDTKMRKLAKMANTTPAAFRYGVDQAPPAPRKSRIIPVVGYVGAGAFHPIHDTPEGQGIDEFELDNDDDIDPVILVIRGDSDFPVYRDGERVRGSRKHGRDINSCVGLDCIIQLADGTLTLKKLLAGSKKGTFTLVPYNAAYEPQQDVKIEWCAPVRRIYRG